MIYFQVSFFLVGLCTLQFVNTAPNRKPRLVGVNSTEYNKFPYNVILFQKYQEELYVICSGSILENNFVITAAHCFDFLLPGASIILKAGANNIYDEHDIYTVTADVQKIFIPQLYEDTSRNEGDISVLKLKTPLNLTKNTYLKTVQILKNDNNTHAGEVAVVSGYGISKYKIGLPLREALDGNLRAANTTVISDFECQKRSKLTTEKHLCADFDHESPKGICDGDSGGPLIYSNNILIGIAESNNSYDCYDDSTPTVFTRVSKFEKFIETAKNYDSVSVESLKIYL